MAVVPEAILSHNDYLQNEANSDAKHEYFDGEIWAMVGATDAHVTIALSLAVILKQHLKGTPCRTYISDMKVRVEQADAYFYPDVLVSCDPRDLENPLIKTHPSFIAEVLSPSTEAFDRGRKFGCYRQLESLQCYWLIDPQKRVIDSFVRADNNDWLLHSYTEADERVEITTLDLSCTLNDIYADVLT